MEFKHWLFNEEDSAGMDGPGGKYWDLVYPSDLDYGRNSIKPKYNWWMQWRIKRGLEIGRPTHNIDTDEFINHKYTAVASNAPPASGGFWEHKPDDGRGYVKPVENLDMYPIAMGPCADSCRIVGEPLDTHGFKDTFPVHSKGSAEIDRIFGDKAGKWPEISDALR
jgi:hypothetical protein